MRLLELIPALDGDVAGGEAAEGVDERFGEAGVGEQGGVEIYSGTAADALDATYSLYIELLRRELDGGVSLIRFWTKREEIPYKVRASREQ